MCVEGAQQERLACLQEQVWHKCQMKAAAHCSTGRCTLEIEQPHLTSTLTKAHVWSLQGRFAEDCIKPRDRVEIAHFSTQSYICENELESCHTVDQQMRVELAVCTVRICGDNAAHAPAGIYSWSTQELLSVLLLAHAKAAQRNSGALEVVGPAYLVR